MYGLQTLYYTNPGPGGRQIVVEGDLRQAVKVYQAGDWITEAMAKHLGIYEWLVVGDAPSGLQARGVSDDPDAQSRQAAEMSQKVREASAARQPIRSTGREVLAYVENATGQPTEVTAAERAEAGSLGAQMTGPTIPEVAEAGGYVEATEKASAEMTSGQTPPREGQGRQARTPAPSTPTPPPSEPPKP
jgi:hypothetical protein